MQDYIERNIDINVKIDKITVKQFDNDSRYLHVTIRDDDLPDSDDKAFNLTGCTAALYIQPAGDESGANVAFVAGEVADEEAGIVTFLLPGGVTQVVGDYECEIWIYEGNTTNRPIISGKTFLMTVEKSIRNTSAIMASPRFSALDAAMSEIASVRSEVNELVASPGGSGGDAGTEVRNIRIGWDGYPYDTAGDAVRKQLRALYDQLNETVIVGKNVFNPETVLLNYTLDTTDGTLVSAEGAMVSDKIWRHGAAYAIFSYLSSNGTHAPQMFIMAQYGADDSFIYFSNSTVNGYDANGAVALDGECAYIRFCTSSAFAQHRDRIMVELSDGNTMSDFEPYHMYLNPQISVKEGLADELATLDELDGHFEAGRNVFNPGTVLLNTSLDTTTGAFDDTREDAAGAMVSDKIMVHGAAKVITSYVSTQGVQMLRNFRIFQYRADDVFITVDTASIVTPNPRCAYIRIYASSAFVPHRDRIMVELADGNAANCSDFVPYALHELAADVSVRKGLREELKQVESTGKKFIPGKNVFDPAAALIGYTLNTTTGALEASAGAMVSDRIETGGAGYVVFSYLASSSGAQGFQNFPVFQYDADGRFLSVTTGSKVALREDCACIRFSASATFAAKKYQIMAELTDTIPENPSPFERYRTRLAGDVVTMLPIFAITSRLILSPATVKIKLLGDSITFGKSSTGSDENGEGFLTYERTVNGVTETVTRRRSAGTHSWAARLKARIEAGYNATVTNNAVSGWRTDEVLRYWNQLIDGTEDIVIVMLGTNNRTKENGQWLLYNDLQTIKDTVEANGGEVIFMSAPPAGTDNENREDDGRNGAMQFHMNDVDDIIAKFAADNHREYISLYKRTLRYMEDTGTPITDLLANEAHPNYHLHPNDRLHKLMYQWVMDGLGLNREAGCWEEE